MQKTGRFDSLVENRGMSLHLGIPKPFEIDPTWMTSALRASDTADGTAAVSRLTCTPIGSGQMGESFRFDLEWVGDGATGAPLPTTVVGKFASSDPNSREAGRMGAYAKEIGFYRELQSKANVPSPVPYYVAFDGESADFVVLMSDLAPAEQGDQIAGCNLNQATRAVHAIAGLHASTWGQTDELGSFEWLPPRSSDYVSLHAQLYRALFDGFAAEYGAAIGPEDIDLGRWVGENYERLLNAHRLPMCVVHNDFRLDNVMFTDSSVSVVDWQTLSVGFGPVDVAYFVGAGMVPPPTDAEERGLVKSYAMRLGELGIAADETELWRSYRLGSVSGYIMAVIASQLVVRTPRGMEMFRAMASRHAQQMRRVGFADAIG